MDRAGGREESEVARWIAEVDRARRAGGSFGRGAVRGGQKLGTKSNVGRQIASAVEKARAGRPRRREIGIENEGVGNRFHAFRGICDFAELLQVIRAIL